MDRRKALDGAAVPLARTSYLPVASAASPPAAVFTQSPAHPAHPTDDRSIPRDAILLPPELDPESVDGDPDDDGWELIPDCWWEDPELWPKLTDEFSYGIPSDFGIARKDPAGVEP